jgi:PAS domain S-box-containing protein
MAGGFAVLVIFTGAAAFLRIINPIIRRLKADTHQLEEMMAALRNAHNELEMRVGERTAALSKTNEALEKEIADRAKAESALIESERKYRTLFESAPVGISITSFDGHVLATNDRLLEMMGYSREDVDAQRLNVKEIYANPTDRDILLKQVRTLGFTRDVELELRRKNGTLLQACVSPTLFIYGGQEAILTVFDDISESKANLEKLKETSAELRYLSEQLIAAQEKERQRIALELHDSIGQMLSAIRISVNSVLDRLKTGGGLDLAAESLASVITMTRQAIEEVRRITMALRPSTLDDLGILPTISWFFRDYQKVYSGIQVKPVIAIRENEVPPELKTPIFRILQEAMNNVAKHSRASSVGFRLGRVDNRLEMRINDNGRGFFLGQKDTRGSSRKGLGLTSMRERATLSGGAFFMDSVKGFGTSVRISWSLETVDGGAAGKREEP